MVGFPESPDRCQVCGETMRRRKGKAVCSPACRRTRSRQREAEDRETRDREIRALLLRAQESVEAALTTLNGGAL